MIEYRLVDPNDSTMSYHRWLNEMGREGWILCGTPSSTRWIFYRHVPDPTPDGEAIGQMVQEDVDEESSQRAMLRRGLLTVSEAAQKLKECSQAGMISAKDLIGDHGEPEPVMPKTILVQPLGKSDEKIQKMVQQMYATPDPQETFYQMWSRLVAVPAKYLWPDQSRKSENQS